MKVTTTKAEVKVLHYLGFNEDLDIVNLMKVESKHLKTYDYCNRSILNYEICK